MWWVYVVRCADGTLYTGVAKRLLARLREHNQDERRGARYTRGRRPVALHAACRSAAALIGLRRRGWSGRSSAYRGRARRLSSARPTG